MQPEPPLNPLEANSHPYDWALGLGLLLLLHLIQIPLAAMTMGISLIAIGLTQLAYVIPAIIFCIRNDRPGLAKGVIIGAALTFLLNGTCTIYFLSNPVNFH